MNGKIARIQDLLAAKWEIEDIESNDAAIAVLLRRGKALTTITLDQQDAWDVLYGDAFTRATSASGAARREVEVTR